MKKDEKSFQAQFDVYQNTWSKQRAKRRKEISLKIELNSNESDSESNDVSCKRDVQEDTSSKLESPKENDNSKPILQLEFRLKFKPNTNDQIIMLEMHSENISLSHVREYLNQILQYIKNNIYK